MDYHDECNGLYSIYMAVIHVCISVDITSAVVTMCHLNLQSWQAMTHFCFYIKHGPSTLSPNGYVDSISLYVITHIDLMNKNSSLKTVNRQMTAALTNMGLG
jgi:hypothetical protein